MTNEDIIKELTLMRKNFDSNSVYGSYCIDCLDAAIEALTIVNSPSLTLKRLGEFHADVRYRNEHMGKRTNVVENL